MLFTVIVAWLGFSCAFTILDGWYWTSVLPRLTEKCGFKDPELRRQVFLLARPMAKLVVIPLALANHANLTNNQPLAMVFVLLAAGLFTGFFALMLLLSWSLGWRCLSLGFASVVLGLSAPAFGVAAYFQSSGDYEGAERFWVPATVASLTAVTVRFTFQLKENVSKRIEMRRHRRPQHKSRHRHRNQRRR